MAYARSYPTSRPMGEINTTPLIDVLLVLLIMMIITIPAATDSLEVQLPTPPEPGKRVPIHEITNKLALTADGDLLWNDRQVSEATLRDALHKTTLFAKEPELQFEPEALASYERSARTLNLIKRSGVTNFGFVGNERYREFERH